MIASKQVYYFAVVYVPFGDDAQAATIFKVLKLNIEELQMTGIPIIMGDFNAWAPELTNDGRDAPNDNGNRLIKMLTKTGYSACKNHNQQEDNMHWTFRGPNDSKSITDYILYPNHVHKHMNNYNVHASLSCGSYHALMTAELSTSGVEQFTWGEFSRPRTEWSTDNIECYRKNFATSPEPVMDTKQQLCAASKELVSAIQEAHSSIITKPSKRKRKEQSNNTGYQKITKAIDGLIGSMSSKPKQQRTEAWEEVHRLQNKLRKIALNDYCEDHKQWWKALSRMDMEQNPQEYWKLIRKLRSKDSPPFPSFLVAQNGEVIRDKNDIKQTVADYFKSISENEDKEALGFSDLTASSAEAKETQPERAKIKTNNLTTMKDFTMKELDKAIKNGNNNKAGGPDDTIYECFKNLPEHVTILLLKVMNRAMQLKFTPEAWQKSITKLIFKKGNHNMIENYRPITLLNTIFKIWERLLLVRLREQLAPRLSNLQHGSKQGVGAVDALLALNMLKDNNKSRFMCTVTIDLSKAYNRVDRTKLRGKLHEANIQLDLINCIMSTYAAHTETFGIGKEKTKEVRMRKGLRQGSVLSPILFILYVNDLIDELQESSEGIPTLGLPPHHKTANLMFVDDLHLMADTIEALEKLILIVVRYAKENGLVVNIKKSSIMMGKDTDESDNLEEIRNRNPLVAQMSTVESSTYLGGIQSLNNKHTWAHIKNRTAKMRSTLQEMRLKGLHHSILGRQQVSRIYQTIIIPILTYAMEAYHLDDKMYQYMDDAIMKALSSTSDANITFAAWELYEESIMPPSVVIKRNKLALYAKHSLETSSSLASVILRNYAEAFLHAEAQEIMADWDIHQFEFMGDVPKSKVKKIIKEKAEEYRISQVLDALNGSSWDNGPYDGPPDTIAFEADEKTQCIKQIRARILFECMEQEEPTCVLCEAKHRGHVTHTVTECKHPTVSLRRENVKIKMKAFNEQYADFIASMEPLHQSMAMAGLISANVDTETAKFIHEISPEIFKEWYYADKGLISAADLIAAAMRSDQKF